MTPRHTAPDIRRRNRAINARNSWRRRRRLLRTFDCRLWDTGGPSTFDDCLSPMITDRGRCVAGEGATGGSERGGDARTATSSSFNVRPAEAGGASFYSFCVVGSTPVDLITTVCIRLVRSRISWCVRIRSLVGSRGVPRSRGGFAEK